MGGQRRPSVVLCVRWGFWNIMFRGGTGERLRAAGEPNDECTSTCCDLQVLHLAECCIISTKISHQYCNLGLLAQLGERQTEVRIDQAI